MKSSIKWNPTRNEPDFELRSIWHRPVAFLKRFLERGNHLAAWFYLQEKRGTGKRQLSLVSGSALNSLIRLYSITWSLLYCLLICRIKPGSVGGAWRGRGLNEKLCVQTLIAVSCSWEVATRLCKMHLLKDAEIFAVGYFSNSNPGVCIISSVCFDREAEKGKRKRKETKE